VTFTKPAGLVKVSFLVVTLRLSFPFSITLGDR
jgi:hypothetical protein